MPMRRKEKNSKNTERDFEKTVQPDKEEEESCAGREREREGGRRRGGRRRKEVTERQHQHSDCKGPREGAENRGKKRLENKKTMLGRNVADRKREKKWKRERRSAAVLEEDKEGKPSGELERKNE